MKKERNRRDGTNLWDFQRQSFTKATDRTRFYERFGSFLCGFVLLSVPGILTTGYGEVFWMYGGRVPIYVILAFLTLVSTFLIASLKEKLVCPIGETRMLLLLALPLTALGLFLMSMLPSKGSVCWMLLDTVFFVLAYPLLLSGNRQKSAFYAGFIIGLAVLFKRPLYYDRRGWILFMCMGAFLMDLGILMQLIYSIPEKSGNEEWQLSDRKLQVRTWLLLYIQCLLPILASLLLKALKTWI